jgi:hypothetical protein
MLGSPAARKDAGTATSRGFPPASVRRMMSAGVLVPVALFLGSLIYLALCSDQVVGAYDEGITLFGAERVLRGDVPHRDFYVLYGPGQFYVVAWLYKLFGTSVLVERAWTATASAASVVLVFRIVDRVAPRRYAVLAAVLALPWFQNTHPNGAATIPCMAAMLAGLFFLAPMLGGGAAPRSPRLGATSRLAAAGLCAGLVMLFRYDVGVAVFGVECALLAAATWFERPAQTNPLHAVIRCLIVFGAGFAAVTLPVAIAYAVNGVLPDFWFDVVAFPASAYVRTRGLPLPRLLMLRTDPVEFLGIYLPLILCAAAVPTMIAALVSRRWALLWTLLALVALELVWFGKGFVRASVLQMAMALVLGAPLATVLAQPIPGRSRIGTAVAAGALVLFLGETMGAERPALARIVDNLRHPPDCRAPAGLQRMACFRLSPETVATVQYVQLHTAPDDPIFIGVSRHDRIFANDLALDFAINRPSATKWHQFDPGLQTSAPIQQEMVGELQRTHPKLIILESGWDNTDEPNESSMSSGVTVLDDYLRRTYVPTAVFGRNTIEEIRPVLPPP